MEHLEMGGAQLILESPNAMPMYAHRYGGRLPSGELALTEQAQRQHRILNGTASLRPGTFPEEMRSFLRTFFDIVAHEFGRTGLGRVQILDWLLEDDTTWPSFLSGGFHHMGTTRMHEDARQGVVDANGKVHAIDNLYVAGAAVFPTSGAPNPTLTLIALTVRLSDHLKQNIE